VDREVVSTNLQDHVSMEIRKGHDSVPFGVILATLNDVRTGGSGERMKFTHHGAHETLHVSAKYGRSGHPILQDDSVRFATSTKCKGVMFFGIIQMSFLN